MKHNAYYVEVWARGGGLVIRSERTDSAGRAKRMALDMGAVDGWYTRTWIEHADGRVTVLSDHELGRLDTP